VNHSSFVERKIEPLVSVGMASTLKAMPTTLTSENKSNDNINNNNNEKKSKNSDKPHSPITGELQDVDAEN
jgi:hypothetical protein